MLLSGNSQEFDLKATIGIVPIEEMIAIFRPATYAEVEEIRFEEP